MTRIKDGNGLYLSPVATSGYKGATILFSGPYADEYIPYVNVPPHLQDMKKEKSTSALICFANVQPLYYSALNRKLTFKDVRQAAYVAQQFELNLEENLKRFWNGDTSMVIRPPLEWESEVDPSSIAKVNTARKEANKERKFPKKVTYDAQTAMYAVYSKCPHKYKKIGADVAPMIRNAIMSYGPTTNSEFLKAAELVLSRYYC
jgi:hypothetical protein